MVPAAPWVLRMPISNCPGAHGTGGVAGGVGVSVAPGVAVTTAVGVTGNVVGSVLVAVGDAAPHAPSRPAAASKPIGTCSRRIATQGPRNPRVARVTEWPGFPGRRAGPGQTDRLVRRRARRCS